MNLRLAPLVLAITLGWSGIAAAHCDTLDGPVVGAGRKALDSGQIEHALVWVQKSDERAVRDAFAKARAARASGKGDTERTDHAFYGTLVRVHRQGEGAPYTGLKPAGHIEPAIAAADKAIDAGSPAAVESLLVEQTRTGLHQRFDEVARRRNFAPSDVEAGRAYVGAYVDYVHYVERVHDAAAQTSAAHDQHKAEATRPASKPGAASGKHGH